MKDKSKETDARRFRVLILHCDYIEILKSKLNPNDETDKMILAEINRQMERAKDWNRMKK